MLYNLQSLCCAHFFFYSGQDINDCALTINSTKPPSGNLVCLLPQVLTDCSSLCVYCCSADSRIINRTKWTPVFCKPASGEHSVCCCLQLLTSIQKTEDSLSSSPSQAKKKKKKKMLPDWNEIYFLQIFFFSYFLFFNLFFTVLY